MTQYGGILGFLAEACDIQRELGVSADEAHAIQRERSAERWREYERQQSDEAYDVRLDRVAQRVAENMGCTPEAARLHLDAWDEFHKEQFCEGNVIPFRARQ